MHERFAASSLPKHPVCVHVKRTRLHVMHSPSFSLSLSSLHEGERFSQKHAKYPAGCADTCDTRKERKAEFRKLMQPPPTAYLAYGNIESEVTFYDAPDPFLGTPSSEMRTPTKETVTDIRRFSGQDLFYRASFSARRQISSGPQTRFG